MSEYDNLLRTRPEILSSAEDDQTFDLHGKTIAFKEKLDNLERVHNGILAELADKRNTLIDQISNEISSLDLAKAENLKRYE